jgi:hypothetical protein
VIRRPAPVAGLLAIVLATTLAGCARPAGTPAASVPVPDEASAAATASVRPSAMPGPSHAPATPGTGATIDIDLDAIRAGLLGPSPVPEGWEEQVDEIMDDIESAMKEFRVPSVEGMPDEHAACATWEPLVGRLSWATGALVERQVMVAHLAQLGDVAPATIDADAAEALQVVSAAAAEQFDPEGDPDVISTAPDEAFRAIGLWALEHCELPVKAEESPDTEEWTEEDIAYSCDLDRSLLERAMQEFVEGPGNGRHASHPHELEISLEAFAYPAWHRIAVEDDAAGEPAYAVEPIPEGFCDR